MGCITLQCCILLALRCCVGTTPFRAVPPPSHSLLGTLQHVFACALCHCARLCDCAVARACRRTSARFPPSTYSMRMNNVGTYQTYLLSKPGPKGLVKRSGQKAWPKGLAKGLAKSRAKRPGKKAWPQCLAKRPGRKKPGKKAWQKKPGPKSLAKKPGQEAWPRGLAKRPGQKAWPKGPGQSLAKC